MKRLRIALTVLGSIAVGVFPLSLRRAAVAVIPSNEKPDALSGKKSVTETLALWPGRVRSVELFCT
jgi:hypothetical protein